MSVHRWRFSVDLLLAASMSGLIWTGLFMWLILPPHSRDNTVWGLVRHDWGEIHFWIAVTFVTGLLIHIVLNWAWFLALLCKAIHRHQVLGTGKRCVIGSMCLLAVIALFVLTLFWANQSKVIIEDPRPRRGWRHQVTLPPTPLAMTLQNARR